MSEEICKLVWITPEAERFIGYCARVSNPANQDNPEVAKLLSYCIRNKHWSIFEMACMAVEINTTVPIAAQILRHKSAFFQQFSARFAEVQGFTKVTPRRQDTKNRQNSIDDLSPEDKIWFDQGLQSLQEQAQRFYKEALERGVAKECARFALPQSASTRMYMQATIRTWIHYIDLRTGNGTQKEHQEVALAIKRIFVAQLPVIAAALGWE